MDFLFIHPYLIDGFTHFEEIIPAKKIQKRGFGGGGGVVEVSKLQVPVECTG